MATTSTPFRPDAEVSAGYWIIDRTHSRIGFRVRNWIVTTVTGAFAEYDGALDWRNEAERSTATLSLSAASIGTGVDTRDAHLCSAHFFDVDRYPTITFSSTEIEPLGRGVVSATVVDPPAVRRGLLEGSQGLTDPRRHPSQTATLGAHICGRGGSYANAVPKDTKPRFPHNYAGSRAMELSGFEPLTSWVRSRRSPN